MTVKPIKVIGPKGATSGAKRNLKITLRDALNEIAVEYQKEMNTAKSLGFQAKKGCLEDLIIQKKAEFSISEDIIIKKSTIRSRCERDKPIVHGMGPESPMSAADPQLIELIIKMGRIRRCLTPTQCLHLAKDLVKGTEIEKKVVAFKKKLFRKNYEDSDLGMRYWHGF